MHAIRRLLGWLLLIGAACYLCFLVASMLGYGNEVVPAQSNLRNRIGATISAFWLVTVFWTGRCLSMDGKPMRLKSLAGLIAFWGVSICYFAWPIPRPPDTSSLVAFLGFIYTMYAVPLFQLLDASLPGGKAPIQPPPEP